MVKSHGLLELFKPEEGIDVLADIVFVHGLFGDRCGTWTISRSAKCDDTTEHKRWTEEISSSLRKMFSGSKTKEEASAQAKTSLDTVIEETKVPKRPVNVFWPRDLLPVEFPNCRIFTWGYDVDIDRACYSTSTATVFQHATNLLTDLADIRMTNEERERPLIFIAHSLGGIVVKDALNQSLLARTYLKDIAPATIGICFLGTPHRGSSVAAIGETLFRITKFYGKSPNLKILQALKYDAETLSRVHSSFLLTLCDPRCHIQVRSFCEATRTHGMQVVDRFSSIIGNTMEVVSDIHANHSDMTKFVNAEDPGFLSICRSLSRFVSDMQGAQDDYERATELLQARCLQSLKNEIRRSRISDVKSAYQGTFSWLLSDNLPFKTWIQGRTPKDSPIFWIQGKPGSGKSTLMKYILSHPEIHDMLRGDSTDKWLILPFFFHDRGLSLLQKTTEGLLQEILYCLLGDNEELLKLVVTIRIRNMLDHSSDFTPKIVERQKRVNLSIRDKRHANLKLIISNDLFRSSIFTSEKWTMTELEEAILAVIGQEKVALNALFLIDALDEHHGSHRDLVEILQRFGTRKTQANVNIKLCLASRPEPVFWKAFQLCPGVIIHEHTASDVKRYTRERIQTSIDEYSEEQDISQLLQLSADITEKANGVFIWVRIVVTELIERFIEGNTFSQLQRILHHIPEELESLYQRVISRPKSSPEYSLESYVLFQVLQMSRESHDIRSLLAATDIVLYGKTETMSKRAMRDRLSSRCGGLIEASAPTFQAKFLHQTVKTFLEARNNAISMFKEQNEAPAETGSHYMLRFCVEVALNRNKAEFLDFKRHVRHLFTYGREAERTSPENAIDVLDRLLAEPYMKREPLESSYPFTRAQNTSRSHELLLQAASHGLLQYVKQKTASGVSATPFKCCPLLYGVVGYVQSDGWIAEIEAATQTPKILKLLMENGADPNTKFQNSTPLAFLVREVPKYAYRLSPKHWVVLLDCIRVLLENGSDPNERTRRNNGREFRSPLSQLMQFISSVDPHIVEMSRILLQHGADPNLKDSDGFTPLFFANDRDNWEATRLLLDYGADPTDLGNNRSLSVE